MTPNLLGVDRLIAHESGADLRGFYVGKVVDDGETDSQGRIKARIEALFGDEKTGVPDDELPWLMMMPSCGLYVRPQVDDFVTVMFQGSLHEGFYTGHTVHAQSKSENIDLGVFGGKLNDYFVLNFHNSFIRGKYDGSEFELNVNKNTTIKIDGNGNVNVDLIESGNLTINNKGNTEITTEGNTNITTTKDTTIETKGNTTIDTTGTTDIKSTGAITIDGTASVDIKSPNTTLSGLAVNIGGVVAPTGKGAFCGLPACLFTGAPHVGETSTGN